MNRLDVRLETGGEVVRVGELLAKDGRTYFQYDPAFRSRGVELSPFKLPTEVAEPLEERTRVYGGLHGLFNDSLPDGWGLMLIERTLRSRGLDAARITPLDRLAFIGRRGMGALTYDSRLGRATRDRSQRDRRAVPARACWLDRRPPPRARARGWLADGSAA